MHITIDTDNLSEQDVRLLTLIIGGDAEPKKTKAAPAKAAKAAPKTEEKPAAEEEPEVEEEGSATMADAVAAATKLVSEGNAAKVKEALGEVGAKRVSEMDESDVPAFLAALDS